MKGALSALSLSFFIAAAIIFVGYRDKGAELIYPAWFLIYGDYLYFLVASLAGAAFFARLIYGLDLVLFSIKLGVSWLLPSAAFLMLGDYIIQDHWKVVISGISIAMPALFLLALVLNNSTANNQMTR